MRRLLLLLVAIFAFGYSHTWAQSRQVSGRVVSSEDNQSIPGVSVFVKGFPNIGTFTDGSGNYSLRNIPANATTLVFSSVGYQSQEIAIVGNTLNVSLISEAKRIDEVVVTAMGISREKKALGYSVQDVKSEDLIRGASSDVVSALQGKVAGVEISSSSGMPGASSMLTIRGSRSFTGNNTPLYVVDGLPINSTSDISTGNSVTGADYSNRFLDIDPVDIESINVLKGQAASALYGMRASNGVIIITTKSGKGLAKGKPAISFSSNVAFDFLSVLPKFQKEYAQGTSPLAFNPTSSLSWGPKIIDLPKDAVYGGETTNNFTNTSGNKPGMYYVPQRAAAGLDPWVKPQAYDNAKEYFDIGYTWNNSINIAQAYDKSHYSFSMGNSKSQGIVPSTGLERYNAKLAVETELYKNWAAGFNSNYITSNLSKQSGANNGLIATIYPASPNYDLRGIPSNVVGDPYRQVNYRGGSFDNAYWAVKNNQFKEKTNRFFGNAYLKYSTDFNTDVHSLNVKYQIGADSYTTNYTDLFGFGSGRNRSGEIEHTDVTVLEMNSLFTIDYSWDINENMKFEILYGNEVVDYKRKSLSASGQNFLFSGWNHLNNASVFQASEAFNQRRTIGNFSSLSLSYRNMLFLNATGRSDIVSTMPRGNRSFFYPSASLGWIFTELEPLKNSILTYGKLRLSYAEVGQAGNYFVDFYNRPTYGGGFSSGTPIVYPIGSVVAFIPSNTVYDPNLRPQNTTSYEVGADLGFFNGRIQLEYTFSRQNVVDQIFPVPLAGSTGAAQFITNGGSVHTNAHEVIFNMTAIDKGNFKWDFGFNFSKIDNYVDDLAPGVSSIFLGGFVTPQVRAGIGDKFPVVYGDGFLRDRKSVV